MRARARERAGAYATIVTWSSGTLSNVLHYSILCHARWCRAEGLCWDRIYLEMEQLIKQVWVSVLGPVFPKTSQTGGAGAAAELRDVLRGGEGSAKISGRKDVQDMVKSGYGENERIISDVIQPGCKCTKVTLYGSGLFPRAPFRLRLCLHFRGQLTERERETDTHTHTKIHCLQDLTNFA